MSAIRTQHTPGPWDVTEGALSFFVRSNGARIAEIQKSRPGFERDELGANARLIAAAPKMLDLIEAMAHSRGPSNHQDVLVNDARALLAKIEGKD